MNGFTIAEFLIAVAGLALVSVIVLPRLAATTERSTAQALAGHLKLIRTQLELYKVHHGAYPTGLGQTFKDQLTSYTDQRHATSPRKHEPTGAVFGPYLLAFPMNPFNGAADVSDSDAAPHKGWYYNPRTGQFRTNDTIHDSL